MKFYIRQCPDDKGLGVFKGTRIKRGAVITMYPTKPCPSPDTDPYAMRDAEFGMITGDRLPVGRIPKNVPFGHMFNDPCILKNRGQWPGFDVWLEDQKAYTRATISSCNVMYLPNRTVIALNTIGAGEEMLMSYGSTYWTSMWYGKRVTKMTGMLIAMYAELIIPSDAILRIPMSLGAVIRRNDVMGGMALMHNAKIRYRYFHDGAGSGVSCDDFNSAYDAIDDIESAVTGDDMKALFRVVNSILQLPA